MRRGHRGSGVYRNRTPRRAVCEVPPAPREQLGPGAARSDSKGSGPARLQPEGRANPGSRTDGTGALHLRREEACPRWQFCFPGKSRIRSPGHPARLEEVSLTMLALTRQGCLRSRSGGRSSGARPGRDPGTVRQEPAPRTSQSPRFSLHAETRLARPQVPQASCSGGRRARTRGGRAKSGGTGSAAPRTPPQPGHSAPRPGPEYALPAPPGPPSAKPAWGTRGDLLHALLPSAPREPAPSASGDRAPGGPRHTRLAFSPTSPPGWALLAPGLGWLGEAAGRRLFFFFPSSLLTLQNACFSEGKSKDPSPRCGVRTSPRPRLLRPRC